MDIAAKIPLADYVSNVYQLADVKGLKWRRYQGRNDSTSLPLNDPILVSYANALAQGVLCVWQNLRHTAASCNNGEDETVLPNDGTNQDENRCYNLSRSGVKELWLFWFGDDPNLSNILSSELKDVEYGTFKDGLTHQCRILLFKAIHNSIERGLLAKSFVRYGKWFVEPCRKDQADSVSQKQVSVAFTFFIFGESTVCTCAEVQRHSPLFMLTVDDITTAQQSDGLEVMLSPFGLKGTLTGRTYSALDDSRELLKEWNHFYPIHLNSDSFLNANRSGVNPPVPPVIEVVLDKVRMKYPTCYVLVPSAIETKRNSSEKAQKNNLDEGATALPPDFVSKLTHCIWHRCSASYADRSTQSADASSTDETHDIFGISQSSKIWKVVDLSLQSKCTCPLVSNVTKNTTVGPKKTGLLQIQPNNTKPVVKSEQKSVSAPILETYHKRRFPTNDENKPKTSQVITNGSNDPIPYNGSVTLEECESKRIILKIINPSKNAFVSSSTSSYSSISLDSPYLSDNALSSPKTKIEKEKEIRLLNRKLSGFGFGKKFFSTAAIYNEAFSRYPWQFYDLPNEGELKPPSLPIDKEESRIFDNARKRNAKNSDTKSAAAKAKGAASNTETSQVIPKKKPRRNSTIPKKNAGGNKRKNSIKNTVGAGINSAVTLNAKAAVGDNDDNKGSLENVTANDSNTITQKTETGKKRKMMEGDGTSASPITSITPISLTSDKSSTILPSIDDSLCPPVAPSRLSRPEDLMVTAADLDQIFNTDDEFDPTGNQMEEQPDIECTSQATSVVTAHNGGSSTDIMNIFPTPPSLDQNSTLSPVMVVDSNETSHLPSNDRLVRRSEVMTSAKVDNNMKIDNCSAATPYSVIDCLPSSKISSLALNDKLRYVPDKKPVYRNGYCSISSRSNLSYFKLTTAENEGTVGKSQESESSPSSPSDSESQADNELREDLFLPTITTVYSSLPEAHSLCVNLVMSDSILNLHLDSNYECLEDLHSAIDLYRSVDDLPSRKLSRQLSRQFEVLLSEAGIFEDDVASLLRDFFPGSISRNLPEKKGIGKNKINNSGCLSDVVLYILCNQCMDAVFDQRFRINRRIESAKKTDKSFKKLIFRSVLHTVYKDAMVYSQLVLNQSNVHDGSTATNENRWEYLEHYESNGRKPPTTLVEDVLYRLQPMLNDILQRSTSSSWENTYKSFIQGPLTWQDLYNKANKGNNDNITLPIPKVMTGYEQEWLAVSPFAIPHWERLSLEPYATQNDIIYAVVAPQNGSTYDHVKSYFKELSSVYESCKLGSHQPITTIYGDGIICVGRHTDRNPKDDKRQHTDKNPKDDKIPEWFHKLEPCSEVSLLKQYIQHCQQQLFFVLKRLEDSALKSQNTKLSVGLSNKTNDNLNGTGIATALMESKKKSSLPCVVVYMVDPFNFSCDSMGDAQSKLKFIDGTTTIYTSTLLIKCFEEAISSLPISIKRHTILHIIPCGNLQHLLTTAPPIRSSLSNLNLLKSVAFSVYVKCQKYAKLTVDAKSLTGFGMAAVRAQIADNEKVVNSYSRIHTPLYVIAPSQHTNYYDLSGVNESMIVPRGQDLAVMFCAYRLSESRQWLLCVCSDISGELMEPAVFHIKSIKRNLSKGDSSSVRAVALKKLLAFCLSLMSKTILQWRLVMIRFGKMGAGEVKDWQHLSSVEHLPTFVAEKIDAKCKLCNIGPSPRLISFSVVSIEPESALRLIPGSQSKSTSSTKEATKSSSIIVISRHTDVSTHSPTSISNSTMPFGSSSTMIEHTTAESNMFQNDESALNDHDNLNDWIHNLVPSFSPTPAQHLSTSIDTTPGKHNIDRTYQDAYKGQKNANDKIKDFVTSHHPLAIGYLLSDIPTAIFFKSFWINSDQSGYSSPVLLKVLLNSYTIINHDNQTNVDSQYALDSSQPCDILRYIMERIDAQSWLTINSTSNQRRSCLPYYLLGLQKLDQLIARL